MNYLYQDFQILVDKSNNIRASSEQGEVSGELQLNKRIIKPILNLIEIRQANKDLQKDLGNELYKALFPDKINIRFHATIAGAKAQSERIRLRLIFESPELASLPWEFLYDEDTNIFLGNNIETVLSRYIDVPLPKSDIKTASLSLKVLLVISSPTDLATLDATGEENLIREALENNIKAGQIELDVLTEATTGKIREQLRTKPYNVFHFIGHGDFKSDKGYIYLVDEYGKSKPLDDENFANFFLGNNHLGLVILNCCRSATVSANQTFAGTASNLVRRGIPAVVAMQYTISDSTAKLFANEFYKTLALGFPVDTAIQETRNAISQDVGLDKRDFATPVLYMRAKDGIILSGIDTKNQLNGISGNNQESKELEQDLSLTPAQNNQLKDAIISAYPSIDKLKMMVYYGLEENLDSIVEKGSLTKVVFELIAWSIEQGKLKELIEAARKENPGNPKLKIVSEELLS